MKQAIPNVVTHDGVNIFRYLRAADFAKIHIGGGEWEILGDRCLRDLDELTIVMEYHRCLAPSLPAREAAMQMLEAAGFETGFGESNFWGYGTLWGWKG